MAPIIFSIAIAWTVALVATPLMIRLAHRVRALDVADGERKRHDKPVPLLGGIAVCLAFCLATLIGRVSLGDVFSDSDFALASWLAAVITITTVGCWDDLRPLRVRWKLLGQALAAALACLALPLSRISLGAWEFDLGSWGTPLTMFWLLACVNGVNFLDGADGVASAVGAAISMLIAITAFLSGRLELAMSAAALTGGLFGFWWYNRPPARIYLGDAGSLLVGLVLGTLALRVSSDSRGTCSLWPPLGFLAIPLADLGLAVIRRVSRRKCFWIADRGHIHHRLQEAGFSAAGLGGIMAILSSLAGLAATMAAMTGQGLWVALTLPALAVFVIQVGWFGDREWRWAMEFLRHGPPPKQVESIDLATRGLRADLPHLLTSPNSAPHQSSAANPSAGAKPLGKGKTNGRGKTHSGGTTNAAAAPGATRLSA